MAENSGFFNALETSTGVYDRVYDASSFAKLFSLFMTNGVFVNPTNQLQVVKKSGLIVTVKSGHAFVDGYWYELTEDKDVTISSNTSSSVKYALVTCKLDRNNRTVGIAVRDNQENINVVNDGNVHELLLAVITVAVGQSSISDSNIVDYRMSSYCGFVTGAVQQIDTENLFAQFEASFVEWFDKMKNQLTTDAAGNLQEQITNVNKDLQNEITDVEKILANHIGNLSVKQYYDLKTGYFKGGRTNIVASASYSTLLNELRDFNDNGTTSGMYFIKVTISLAGTAYDSEYYERELQYEVSFRVAGTVYRTGVVKLRITKTPITMDAIGETSFIVPVNVDKKNEIWIRPVKYSYDTNLLNIPRGWLREEKIEMQKILGEE